MTNFIELGGEQRPIMFGMAALFMYEKRTGRAAIADFSQMDQAGVKLSTVVELVISGLACGYQKERRTIDFEDLDVAEWLGEPDKIETIIGLFTDSLASVKNGVAPNKGATANKKK